MDKIYTYKSTLQRTVLLVFVLLGLAAVAQAQAPTITYTHARNLTKGFGDSTLQVKIRFNNTCTGTSVRIGLPAGVEYIDSSLTIVAASAGLSITESSISDRRSPEFDVSGTIVALDEIEFSIARRATCAAADGGGFDSIWVSFTGGCPDAYITSTSAAGAKNYNILAPAFSINVSGAGAITGTMVGNNVTRTTIVTNGGTGATDTLRYYIAYPGGAFRSNNTDWHIVANGSDFDTTHTNGDTLFYKIYGATLFGGNSTFDPSETVSITEDIRIIKCGTTANTTRYGASWGSSDAALCETGTSTAGVVTVANVLPSIATFIASTNAERYDWCWEGESRVLKIGYRNIGTGPATMLKMTVQTQIPLNYTGWNYLDTAGGWVVKNTAGTVLGTITSFSNPITTNFGNTVLAPGGTPGAACSGQTALMSVTVDFGDIILAPGDTIVLEVKNKAADRRCSDCINNVITTAALATVGSYQNQCGVGNYALGLTAVHSGSYARADYLVEMPTDVSYISPDFNIKVHMTSANYQGQPVSSGIPGSYRMGIPLTGTGMLYNGDTAITATRDGGTIVLGAAVVADTLWLTFPIPATGYSWGYSNIKFNIPMEATCTPGGAVTIGTLFAYQYSSCSPVIKMRCRSQGLTMHCPSPCPKGGATPLMFTLKRTSFGAPDNDSDGLPDASGSIDLSKIDDHQSVNADTLQATWIIRVTGNNDPADVHYLDTVQYVYVDTRLTVGAIGTPGTTLNSLVPQANSLEVYRGGTLVHTVTIPAWTITNTRYAHFALPAPADGWQHNDSIVFKADFSVYAAAGTIGNTSGNAEYSTTFTTANHVYGTYLPQAVNNIAPVADTTYTCDIYNDYSIMHSIRMIPAIGVNQSITGCNNALSSVAQWRVGSYGYVGPFPYEFRNFFLEDTMKVWVPHGFVYRPGSNRIGINLRTPYSVASTISLPDSKIYQVGDTLYFTDIKSVYITHGGTVVPTNQYGQLAVFYSLDATCDAVQGIYAGSTNTSYAGNGVNTRVYDMYNNTANTFRGVQYSNVYTYNAPQPVMAGGGTYQSTDGTATWSIQLQNLSNIASASNTWLYISPTGAFTGIVVREGLTTITPNANGFYELGILATSADRSITVTANTGTCNTDSMRINTGYTCSGYPSSFVLLPCTRYATLIAENPISQLQIRTLRQPGGGATVDLCTTDSATIVLTSSQASYLANPSLHFTPPAGTSMPSSVMAEYPMGSGNYESLPVTTSGSTYIINLAAHTGIGSTGIPGTLDANPAVYPAGQDREVKVKLDFTTDCNFTSGSSFQLYGYGNRPCGTPAIGYGAFTTTDPVQITGAGISGSASMDMSFGSATEITCGGTPTTVSCITRPSGITTVATDTMIYTLPLGMGYAGNFTPGTYAVTVSGGVTIPVIVKVALPAGVPDGTNINFSFDVQGEGAGCNSVNILAGYQRVGAILSCGGTPCPSPSRAIIASNISPDITLSKPNLGISSVSLLDTPVWRLANFNANRVRVYYNNNGTLPYSGGNDTVEFFCNSSTTVPFAKMPLTKNVAVGASDSDEYYIMMPIGSCIPGDVITTRIQTQTAAGTPQCLCSPSSYMMMGVGLPLSFLKTSASVRDCAVNLEWLYNESMPTEGFEIERSNTGSNYQTIAKLAPGAQQHIDVTPNAGTWYYRIRAVKSDGGQAYSSTQVVRTNQCAGSTVSVYPNPAREKLQVVLQGNSNQQSYVLYDMTGRDLIRGVLLPDRNNTIELSGLSKGSYMLRITVDGQSSIHQVQIVK